MSAPVLLIVYNRPATTKRVIESLLKSPVQRIYVAADGPRATRESDLGPCEEVRRLILEAPWKGEVRTLFREENLGCRRAVIGAIDWFFENEEEGIILEDDCVPAADFFPFCASLLERYRHDNRVMAVCGSSYVRDHGAWPYDYIFSQFPDPWGWATWRRAWKLYDGSLEEWRVYEQMRGLQTEKSELSYEEYWTKILSGMAGPRALDTWDYQWIFSLYAQNGLAVYPVKNLISNIGWGADATHTLDRSSNNPLNARELSSLSGDLRHPTSMYRVQRFEEEIRRVRLRIPSNALSARSFRHARSASAVLARALMPRTFIDRAKALLKSHANP